MPVDVEAILEEVEARTHRLEPTEDSVKLSINDWADRIKGKTIEAHGYARSGEVELERDTWLDLAALAVQRVKVLDYLEYLSGAEPASEDGS